jgi:hypothetical protein
MESKGDSPFASDDTFGSRTSLQAIPRIWQAAVKDRNVRVDGCVK